MRVEPYLDFNGQCDAAIEFYKNVLGAKVAMLMRFKDCPDPQPGSIELAMTNKVMHASLTIGESTVMMTDGHCRGATSFSGINLSVRVDDDAHAKRVYEGLAVGGAVVMPLAKTFFSSQFGMVKDRFGITWMVIV